MMKESYIGRRSSNFELLRILCICLIISFHYVRHNTFYFFEEFKYNKIIYDFVYMFGELAVNCFMLISGYFQIKSKFKWRKVVLLIFEVNFYYILSKILLIILGNATWDTWLAKEWIFPVLRDEYWFVTVYIIIYIFSPFINRLCHALRRREYCLLLILLLSVYCIIPTVLLGWTYGEADTEGFMYYNRLIWLLVVYLIGAYIRLYGLNKFNDKKARTTILLITVLGLLFYIGLIEILSSYLGFSDLYAIYFWPPNSIVMIILSVSVFMIFCYANLKYNKFINMLASGTLGVYLLSDGELMSFIWWDVFKPSLHANSHYFVAHICMATILIFTVGTIIELMRKRIEDCTIKRLLNIECINRFEQYIKGIIDRKE